MLYSVRRGGVSAGSAGKKAIWISIFTYTGKVDKLFFGKKNFWQKKLQLVFLHSTSWRIYKQLFQK